MAEIVDICNLALSYVGAPSISSLSDRSKPAIECNRHYEIAKNAVLEDFDWNFASKYLNLTELKQLNFDAGKTAAPSEGSTITGGDSAQTGELVYTDLQSGSWAGNDAAGIFILADYTGAFTDNENITWTGGSATVNEPNGMSDSDYPNWSYCYQYPSDCLTVREIISVTGIKSLSFYDPESEKYDIFGDIEYEIITYEDLNLLMILCNIEDAILRYTAKITDTSLFSNTFIECVARKLAVNLAQPLRGDSKLEGTLLQSYFMALGRAQAKSAKESHKMPKDVNSFTKARL